MRVDRVIITPGRMRIIVVFEIGETRYTNFEMASRALRSYPLLKAHSCINSEGPTFGAVMDHTSIAHLLEHLVIAEQSKLALEKGIDVATFVGNTHWIDKERGIAEVQVSFIDDLDATNALSRALEFICSSN